MLGFTHRFVPTASIGCLSDSSGMTRLITKNEDTPGGPYAKPPPTVCTEGGG